METYPARPGAVLGKRTTVFDRSNFRDVKWSNIL
jgi:hypothetical protein